MSYKSADALVLLVVYCT